MALKEATAVAEGDGDFETEVVGESHYQHNLKRICGPRSPEGEERYVKARLLFENDNPHDKKAVRVDIDMLTVGYLSREDARIIRQSVKRRTPAGVIVTEVYCDAVIRGGWDDGAGARGHYGVWLDVENEDDEEDDEE